MTKFRWEEPPRSRSNRAGRPVKWKAEADALRANPKRWMLLHHYASASSAGSMVASIHHKSRICPFVFREGKWEATSRAHDDGSGDVYVRFLGDDEA